MKSLLRILVASLTILLTHADLNAINYAVSLWEQSDEQEPQQHIWCLPDLHVRHWQTKEQQHEIVQLARALPNAEAIVEDVADMSGYLGQHRTYLACSNMLLPGGQVLVGLTKKLRNANIPCTNVEFRQILSSSKLSQERRIGEMKPIVQELGSTLEYNCSLIRDTPPYRELSTEYILHVIQKLDSLPIQLSKRLVSDVDSFACPLIDLRILHALQQKKNAKHILVCAGSSHIERVEMALPKRGFTRRKHIATHNHSSLIDARTFSEFATSYIQLKYKKQVDLADFFASHVPERAARLKSQRVFTRPVFLTLSALKRGSFFLGASIAGIAITEALLA